jgi:hypothetical protein
MLFNFDTLGYCTLSYIISYITLGHFNYFTLGYFLLF